MYRKFGLPRASGDPSYPCPPHCRSTGPSRRRCQSHARVKLPFRDIVLAEVNPRKLRGRNCEHTPNTLLIVSAREWIKGIDSLLVIRGERRGGANDRGLFSVLEKMRLWTRLARLHSQTSSGKAVSKVHQDAMWAYIERDFALTLDIVQESI